MTTRVTRASAARQAVALTSTSAGASPQQLPTPLPTPGPTSKRLASTRATQKPKGKESAESPVISDAPTTPPNKGRKRKRATAPKADEDINELPHNLGKASRVKEEATALDEKAKQVPKKPVPDNAAFKQVQAIVEAATATVDQSPSKKSRKPKANPYGLTPGETPYPDWPHPTPEECQEVNDLLSQVHGKVQAPATIPAPSTTVSGCGEVPSILDALIRTLLSAATTGANSSRAFKGLVDKFGILQEGIGRGSVNWNKVREADVKDVFEAIKSGGLAATKSKRIKEILDMVYKENQARRDALVDAKHNEKSKGPKGAENESETEKDAEIKRADEHVLSLDHLHALPSEEALAALIKYPGIGPKTASCVLLFCMQRPSFAVDTHVFRLCKWLKWVPPDKATRNTTYSHCEVRVPDELKYPLHQLMIRHGKTCPRCRAATGENSEDWDKGCPIDHLVTRTGKRKGGLTGSPTKKGGKKRQARKKSEGDEEEDSELSDMDEELENDHAEASDDKDGDN